MRSAAGYLGIYAKRQRHWRFKSGHALPALRDFLTRAKTIRDVSVITYRTANELLQLFEAAATKAISKEDSD